MYVYVHIYIYKYMYTFIYMNVYARLPPPQATALLGHPFVASSQGLSSIYKYIYMCIYVYI